MTDSDNADDSGADVEDAEFGSLTTDANVTTYESSSGIFQSLLNEVKELSKKKPEATMSPNKVKIVNRVLEDLLSFLKGEPSGKYLELLDDETLPQMSDAVLVMVQFDSALDGFKSRYFRYVYGERQWATKELADELREMRDRVEDEGDEDDADGDGVA